MDRISQLPESIVHHIISCFNTPRQLLRMSVSSKKWFDLTASFPILYFNIYNFRSRGSFFKYVEHTTSRFCHQNVTAEKLKLIATLQEPSEIDIVNRSLELVLRNGVRELVIEIFNSPDAQRYRLPNTLLSVSVLKSLTLHGCELPSSLMLDAVKFKSLIRLELEKVLIDDDAIKYITTSCPILETFYISMCHGFKSFCVHGHQNLKKVSLHYNTPVDRADIEAAELERIDIEAPNLSELLVTDMDPRGAPLMNLASCKKLTTVTYIGHPIPNSNGFTDFLSNFPFIEKFVLVTNFKCKKLKLSSHTLRKLVLQSDYDLEDIEFSTPNLVLFAYSCKYHLWPTIRNEPWPLLRDSTHLEACMECFPEDCIALWFQKLRLFLDKKNGFKVLNLYIHAIYSRNFKEVLEKLKVIEWPPYELEHVELQLDPHHETSAHISCVDVVLWCCRPRSLTLRSSVPLTDFDDVVKFTNEKLLQQEDERHTNIQIVWPYSSKAQKHSMDLKTMSMALPCEENAISFIKEEGNHFRD